MKPDRKTFLQAFLGAFRKEVVVSETKADCISGRVSYKPDDPEEPQDFSWHGQRYMSNTRQIIGTPLGDILVQAFGADRVITDVIKPEIQLPAGMSVDSLLAVLIKISVSEPLSDFRCECFWDRSPAAGDPESGECLDAKSWDKNGYRVTIGTEDFEALSRRLPFLGLTEAQYPVIYSDQGLAIEIPEVPRHTDFSLHFVVAWRSLPDPAEISTWIAVDIPHSKLEVASKSWHANRP